jgi:hypothetical protein
MTSGGSPIAITENKSGSSLPEGCISYVRE